MQPLADKIRPVDLNDMVGQKHIIGENKIINNIIISGRIPNMIFYGPSGTGKTTLANILAKASNKRFYKLNATNASLKDVKEIINELDSLLNLNGILLYLDEIQNFNKKQQQSLLEFIEDGRITLIASTTENPFFYVYNAILSRSTIFEFKELMNDEIVDALKRGIEILEKEFREAEIVVEREKLEFIASICNGDLRKALNILELSIYTAEQSENRIYVSLDTIKNASGTKKINYDKNGDSHYDTLSAFQKSIRGSDVDASVHYLARLIKSGDLISICRRLLVISAEDVGLAYPNAISIVKACVDSANQLGFPEARIPLAEATILLASAPKSNSAIVAIDTALKDIENVNIGEVPSHLKDAHYKGAVKLGRGVEYKFPHDYPNNYVLQQYLPEEIKDRKYYTAGKNKYEKSIENYLKALEKYV
ncbi:replication-associated recombination protein A [Clostridium sp. DL1XJH146]